MMARLEEIKNGASVHVISVDWIRDGVHYTDTEDMMRRLTKEELLKFDGRPLFPERLACTVKYQFSEEEVRTLESQS